MSILAIATLCLGSVPMAVIHRSINERAFITDTSFVILTSLYKWLKEKSSMQSGDCVTQLYE